MVKYSRRQADPEPATSLIAFIWKRLLQTIPITNIFSAARPGPCMPKTTTKKHLAGTTVQTEFLNASARLKPQDFPRRLRRAANRRIRCKSWFFLRFIHYYLSQPLHFIILSNSGKTHLSFPANFHSISSFLSSDTYHLQPQKISAYNN